MPIRPADEISNAKPQYPTSLGNIDNVKPNVRTVVLRSARDGVLRVGGAGLVHIPLEVIPDGIVIEGLSISSPFARVTS